MNVEVRINVIVGACAIRACVNVDVAKIDII